MKAPFLLCYEGAPERKRIEFPWWTGWLCSVQICVCWPPRIASRMFCDLVSLRTHQTFVGVHRGGQSTGLGEGWVDFRGEMGSEEPGQPMQDFLMSTRMSSAWLSASFPCALRVRPRAPLLGFLAVARVNGTLGCSACNQQARRGPPGPLPRLCSSPEPWMSSLLLVPGLSMGEVCGRRFLFVKNTRRKPLFPEC